jgi:hypothetical protein
LTSHHYYFILVFCQQEGVLLHKKTEKKEKKELLMESRLANSAGALGLEGYLNQLQFLAIGFKGVKLEGLAPLEKGIQKYDPKIQRLIEES